jgi:hypothetical protein
LVVGIIKSGVIKAAAISATLTALTTCTVLPRDELQLDCYNALYTIAAWD